MEEFKFFKVWTYNIIMCKDVKNNKIKTYFHKQINFEGFAVTSNH